MSQISKLWHCDIWKCHKMSQNVTRFQIFGTKLRLSFMFGFGSERLWRDRRREECVAFLFGKTTSPRNCSHEHLEPEIESHDGNCLYKSISKVIISWITANRFPNHRKITSIVLCDGFKRNQQNKLFVPSEWEKKPGKPQKMHRNSFRSCIESIKSVVQRS